MPDPRAVPSPRRLPAFAVFVALAWLAARATLGGAPPVPTSTSTPAPTQTHTVTPTPTSIRTEDLSISTTASPNPVASGQLLTYTFDVTNHGAGLTLESDVMDNLPPEVTFVSCTVVHPNAFSSCSHAGGQISANLGPLAGGSTLSLTVVVQVVASSGSITNTATTGHNGPDPDPSNNTSTIITTIQGGVPQTATPTITPTPFGTATSTPIPNGTNTPTFTPTSNHTDDLSITGTASPEPVASGQLLTYTFEVINLGPGPGVTPNSDVTDHLPPEVTFVSCTPHGNFGANCSGSSQLVTANLGSTFPGNHVSLTIVVLVVATSGTIQNTASVGFNGFDPVPSNDTGTVVSTIGVAPTATPTITPIQVATPTSTPTPVGGGVGGAGSSIPMLSPAARLALLLALLAAGWYLISRRS